MNIKEIDKIDTRVAREVMGFKKVRGLKHYDYNFVGGVPIQEYSTNMCYVMNVVREMNKKGWYLSLDQLEGSCRWEAEFWNGEDQSSGGHVHEEPAMAICLAALAAVGNKDKE